MVKIKPEVGTLLNETRYAEQRFSVYEYKFATKGKGFKVRKLFKTKLGRQNNNSA